jgi:hypothetical protein
VSTRGRCGLRLPPVLLVVGRFRVMLTYSRHGVHDSPGA